DAWWDAQRLRKPREGHGPRHAWASRMEAPAWHGRLSTAGPRTAPLAVPLQQDQPMTSARPSRPPLLPPRRRREERVAPLAARQSGVVSRRQLRALGLSRHDVRTEVEAGRWGRHGHQVITVSGPLLADDTLTRWWAAGLEAGPGAALDGASALQAAGLTGFTPGHIDVCVPMGCRSAERRP